MAKIYIAAGHGGNDPGATYGSVVEKSLNLEIANRVSAILRAAGHEIVQNRSTDIYRDYVKDTADANALKVNAFIVIHHDCNPGTPGYGVEAFYSFTGQGKALAESISGKIAELGYHNRGAKTKSFSALQPKQDYFYVIRESSMEATLVECCFINNASDMAMWNADSIAKAVANGILAVYPSTLPPGPIPDYKTLYEDAAGKIAKIKEIMK